MKRSTEIDVLQGKTAEPGRFLILLSPLSPLSATSIAIIHVKISTYFMIVFPSFTAYSVIKFSIPCIMFQMNPLTNTLILIIVVTVVLSTPLCFPQRWNYRAYKNCLEEDSGATFCVIFFTYSHTFCVYYGTFQHGNLGKFK